MSLVDKIKQSFSGKKKDSGSVMQHAFVADLPPDTPEHVLEMMREFEKIKKDPHQPITGWDFDRAFHFIDKYPDTIQTANLLEEMQQTSSQTLKGLSYESALKVLQMIPSHPGSPSIIRGMYKIDPEYIEELSSEIIMFILEVAPDHPQLEALGKALVYKNFTNAYAFVDDYPDHPQAKRIIEVMFEKDPNIATLLFKEKMDHLQVDAIFEGIYGIDAKNVKRMMPDAILFVLEIAPDHKFERSMIATLVEKNYIKAYNFVVENPDHPHSEYIRTLLIRKKPDLEALLS